MISATKVLIWGFVAVLTNAASLACATESAAATDFSAPITINGEIAKHCGKPEYSAESIENRDAGLVVVKFLIGADGTALNRHIERSSGIARLDEASKRALDLCKFSDEMVSSDPGENWKRIEYLWELGNFKPAFAASNCVRPRYPSRSLQENETGRVTVAFLVDEQGAVTKTHIERSSGYLRLDDATQRAIATCKVTPALESGRAVPGWSRVEYEWLIEGYRRRVKASFAFDAAPPMSPTKRPDWSELLDKPYSELPQWERKQFADMFERINLSDEPPFPLAGLGTLYQPILEVQRRLGTNGMLSLFLTISADGDVTKVDVFASPSKAMKDFAVQLAVLTKFKPGTCAGVPCERGFPLRLRLESN